MHTRIVWQPTITFAGTFEITWRCSSSAFNVREDRVRKRCAWPFSRDPYSACSIFAQISAVEADEKQTDDSMITDDEL